MLLRDAAIILRFCRHDITPPYALLMPRYYYMPAPLRFSLMPDAAIHFDADVAAADAAASHVIADVFAIARQRIQATPDIFAADTRCFAPCLQLPLHLMLMP